MTIRATESELLRDLRRSLALDEAPRDAMTTAEMAKALRVSKTTVKDRLRRYRDQGLLDAYRVKRTDSTGREQIVYAYVMRSKPSRKRSA